MKKTNWLIGILTLAVVMGMASVFGQSSVHPEKNAPTLQMQPKVDSLWTDKIEKPNSYWKKVLGPEQYHIARESGTETPFTHPYLHNKVAGVYLCSVCGNPLFGSEAKFDSGTGWPSFSGPYHSRSVVSSTDTTYGMVRDELSCARCGSHVGHVFGDGPEPTGLRYCINGVSLQFVPKVSSMSNTHKKHMTELKKAVFAQGCFWCTEEIFESVEGVKEVLSGYAGGTKENPIYREVGSGTTGHAESVQVIYDPNIVSYNNLLKVYFNAGDITQVNGQGNDIGTQYRSIVFSNSPTQKKQIEAYIKNLEQSGDYANKIAVEVLPLKKFYKAEDYHQDYIKHHPENPYVQHVSIPRYKKAIMKFPELLKPQ